MADYNGKDRVAVKLMRVQASAEDKSDFLHEAEMMFDLNHPNILKVHY